MYLISRGACPRRVPVIQVLTSASTWVTVPWLITVKLDPCHVYMYLNAGFSLG